MSNKRKDNQKDSQEGYDQYKNYVDGTLLACFTATGVYTLKDSLYPAAEYAYNTIAEPLYQIYSMYF